MNRDEAEKWCHDRDFFYCCMHPDGGIIYFDERNTLRRKDPGDLENSVTAGKTGSNLKKKREEEGKCWMN